MLRTIAVFSMQGILYAAGIIALFSLAALVLPPFNYIASGIIALYTLRMGPKDGIKVIAFSTVILSVITMLFSDKTFISAVFLLSSWLPVLVTSLVLGYTRSLATSLLAAGGMGILFVAGIYLFLPEPALWWQALMTPFWDAVSQQAGWTLDPKETQEMVAVLSAMMTGLVAASLTINIVLGLLIGRALQAKLYNPGGFAGEFHQLSLGKPIAVLATGLMVITILPLGTELTLLRECLPVVLTVFALQGLSVVHAIVKNQQKSTFWLVAIYALLIMILPQMVVILAVIGILEQWFNFRYRSLNDMSD
ncbi:MAG: DUF2232 domain-containing protein [Methylophaga sp.]|nr:MAG: DUF2232 domain-containing protein [Methylophaga sp.]